MSFIYLETAPNSGEFHCRGEVGAGDNPGEFAAQMAKAGLRVVTLSGAEFEWEKDSEGRLAVDGDGNPIRKALVDATISAGGLRLRTLGPAEATGGDGSPRVNVIQRLRTIEPMPEAGDLVAIGGRTMQLTPEGAEYFRERVHEFELVPLPEAGDAGFLPNEGETLIAQVAYKRLLTDRDADLELGLFTNSSPGETIAHSALTEPTGTGYARITLADSGCTVTGDTASWAQQTFTAGAGGWTGSIQGYFICSKAAGGTKRILAIEVDPNGPYTLNAGDTYKITPSVVIA